VTRQDQPGACLLALRFGGGEKKRERGKGALLKAPLTLGGAHDADQNAGGRGKR